MTGLPEQIKALSERASELRDAAELRSEKLSLSDTALSLEHLLDAVDALWSVLGSLNTRVETIREREAWVRARTEKTALDRLDVAEVNLGYGHEGLMVARHLIELGRAELVTVEREGWE
ncbi:hypothetical protein [Spirillospora sp. NPDC029432]|uniref:hypothetical protein n=1 Tax=Spirillospora sp. NPDC029432 TaxID=3154599 RepID=UPI003452F60F